MLYNFEKQDKPTGLRSWILHVLGLIIDANRLLEGPTMCLNPFYALKHAASMISVSPIS